jgi:hypothetical protein
MGIEYHAVILPPGCLVRLRMPDTRRGWGHKPMRPGRNRPRHIYLRRKKCPQSDSNRHLADFKSAASANWAMGASGTAYRVVRLYRNSECSSGWRGVGRGRMPEGAVG